MDNFNEKKLLNLSIIIAFLGTAILFLIVTFSSVDPGKLPNSLQVAACGESIKFEGVVKKVDLNANYSKIIVSSDVFVFAFDSINLSEGTKIRVSGIIEEFRGKKEVKAEKIELLQKW